MSSTHRQGVYLAAAAAGVVVPWIFNLRFMAQHGWRFPAGSFVADAFANPAAASISSDILIVALVLLFWINSEMRRLGMKRYWLYVVLTFSLAAAFSVPFFLFMRERHLARGAESQA